MRAARSRIVRAWLVAATMTLALAPAKAAAQEPVASFDLLNGRLKPGDTVWVTDGKGREIKGRVATLDPSGLTLNGGQGSLTIRADEVRVVRQRVRDSLLNGTLIGFGAGFLVGSAANAEVGVSDAGWCLMFGGIGAGLGALVDGLIPGEKRDVYRAPAPIPTFRFSLAPIVTARTKGVRLSFSF